MKMQRVHPQKRRENHSNGMSNAVQFVHSRLKNSNFVLGVKLKTVATRLLAPDKSPHFATRNETSTLQMLLQYKEMRAVNNFSSRLDAILFRRARFRTTNFPFSQSNNNHACTNTRSCERASGLYTNPPLSPHTSTTTPSMVSGKIQGQPPPRLASLHLVQKRGQGGPVPAIVVRQRPATLFDVEADVGDGHLVQHLAVEVGEAHPPPCSITSQRFQGTTVFLSVIGHTFQDRSALQGGREGGAVR